MLVQLMQSCLTLVWYIWLRCWGCLHVSILCSRSASTAILASNLLVEPWIPTHPSYCMQWKSVKDRFWTCIWYNRLHAPSYGQRLLANVFSIINRHEVSSCWIVFVLFVYRTVYDCVCNYEWYCQVVALSISVLFWLLIVKVYWYNQL